MNERLSDFRDPVTREPLIHDQDTLVGASGSKYPIVNGIPRFVAAENYAADFGLQWNEFPGTQLDSHTGIPMSEERLTRCVGGDLSVLRGKRVLEAGSGAGRFTEVLLKAGAILSSFDFSTAVEANKRNNGASDQLTLAQADIRAIPFEPASFDYVICLGVIQHTPSPEETIASLWKMVKPGGSIVIDHYRFRWRFLLPTPIGDAGSLYRWFILRMPAKKRLGVVRKLTDFWFPVHWRWRDSVFMQRVIRRFSPLRFYYPMFPLRDRTMHYEWSLLDTHDSTTDYYKHLRSVPQIDGLLRDLGATDVEAWVGGNGVEARARKPA
jgi:2-polyprenyl-3-methyl-5-hydroxy-6-metoxy-1,4-benzoquinol methylase